VGDIEAETNDAGGGSPIAMGGVGGSGTRLVASFIRSLGVDIGPRVNPALDNLWFTLLLKRRSWARTPPAKEEIAGAIDTFHNAMTGRGLGRDDLKRIAFSTAECTLMGHNHKGSGRGIWAGKVAMSMISGSKRHPSPRWGWKEPNTHVFLPELSREFPSLTYIHVIRDGLVMVDSGNWDQSALWAARFDMPAQRRRPTRSSMLEYWVRANRRAIDIGSTALGDRFVLVRFESLINDPKRTLRDIARRLGLEVTTEALELIDSVHGGTRPRKTTTADLSVDDWILDGLSRLGYGPDSGDRPSPSGSSV